MAEVPSIWDDEVVRTSFFGLENGSWWRNVGFRLDIEGFLLFGGSELMLALEVMTSSSLVPLDLLNMMVARMRDDDKRWQLFDDDKERENMRQERMRERVRT